MPTAETVLRDYYSLPLVEQYTVKSELINPSFTSGLNLTKYVEENRFASGRVCPLCGCTHIRRNGFRKLVSGERTQRYLCMDCRKSFVATTNSIVAGTRKSIEVWEKFIDCMMNGFTIRRSAKVCHIHQTTAFLWRHKVLDALQHMMEEVHMDGIIEVDETFFNVSYKGNHKHSTTFVMPRTSHHRGRSVKKRGLSNEKVCVPCAVSRNGLSIAKVSNLARVKIEGLRGVFNGRFEEGSVIITDKASSYRKFSKENSLKLCALKSKRDSHKGIYHLQHINSYHSNLKSFIHRFKGVSTKYLNNYLVWHNFLNYSEEEYDEKKKIFLAYTLSVPHHVICKEISKRSNLPILA